MYKRKQNLSILLDVVQYFVLLGQNVFIFLKHLSLFHNFCLETGKTVQKAQNSPKAESEGCGSKKIPLQIGPVKNLWTAFTFNGVFQHVYRQSQSVWSSDLCLSWDRTEDIVREMLSTLIHSTSENFLLRLLWGHRSYFRLSHNKMDGNLLT